MGIMDPYLPLNEPSRQGLGLEPPFRLSLLNGESGSLRGENKEAPEELLEFPQSYPSLTFVCKNLNL